MEHKKLIDTILDHCDDLHSLRGLYADVCAAMSGEGLETWNGREGYVADVPAPGWCLTVRWAIHDQSYETWFPTEEQAMAALHAVAAAEGRVVKERGVDLTHPGCWESRAIVHKVEPPQP